jgi:hypothetical protein
VSLAPAILILLQASAAPASAAGADEMIERARIIPANDGCRSGRAGDEIVVCGRRQDPDRYRLPLRDEPGSLSEYDRAFGDLPRASLETSFAPCGIFQGQRSCSKHEAAAYGYGNGRDPLTVATKLIGSLTDPD